MKKLTLVLFVALTALVVTGCTPGGDSGVIMPSAEKKAALGAGDVAAVPEVLQLQYMTMTQGAAGAIKYDDATSAPTECVRSEKMRADFVNCKKATVLQVIGEERAKEIIALIADAKVCLPDFQYGKTDQVFVTFSDKDAKAIAIALTDTDKVLCKLIFDFTIDQAEVRFLTLAEPIGQTAFASQFTLKLIPPAQLPEKAPMTLLIEQERAIPAGSTQVSVPLEQRARFRVIGDDGAARAARAADAADAASGAAAAEAAAK